MTSAARLRSGARRGLGRTRSALARVGCSRRGRLAVSLGFAVVTTAILVLAGRSLLDSGWPLGHGNPGLVAAAGLLFVLAYAFKAYGWRRLFRAGERPRTLALAAAGGGASIMGVVRRAASTRWSGSRSCAGIPAAPSAFAGCACRSSRWG